MKAFGKESSELYSDIILHLYKEPLNYGSLKKASLEAVGGNPICGDKVHLFVQLKGNTIANASFTSSGCAISTAAASVLTEKIKGKTIRQVLKITPGQLFRELGGVIQTRVKCASLALVSLQNALKEQRKKAKKSR